MKKLFVTLCAVMAIFTISAQDVTATYNASAASLQAKKYADAAKGFETVISEGMATEGAEALVTNAKKYLPMCYFRMGLTCAGQKDFATAILELQKSATFAQMYGDMNQMAKSKGMIAKIYQVQGGEFFNNKDYTAAASIFEKGYKADPRNTKMALLLAMSYCEMGEYAKGMEVYGAVAAMTNPRYADDVAKANEMMTFYTNNEVAKKQAANDYEGIILMANDMLVKNPTNPIALKVRLDAYFSQKNYNQVIELAEEAAAAQINEDDKGAIYFNLGASYNAKEMRDQAKVALQKVKSGPAFETAKAALAELSK